VPTFQKRSQNPQTGIIFAAPTKQSKYHSHSGAGYNLKNIDLELPRDRLILTGVSGSGVILPLTLSSRKGSAVLIPSVAYARQFLGQLDKPDVEAIDW